MALATAEDISAPAREAALAETEAVLKNRLETADLGRPFFQLTNNNQFVIMLPPLAEPEIARTKGLIERPGLLEFRTVHPDSDELLKNDIIEPGYEVLGEQIARPEPGGTGKVFARFLVSRKPATGTIGNQTLPMTGKYLKSVMATRNTVTKRPEIAFEFDAEGTEIFRQITRELSPKGNKYHSLAITLDGVLYSAPRILSEIPGGRGVISGNFTPLEALELAGILEHPLPVKLKVIETKQY